MSGDQREIGLGSVGLRRRWGLLALVLLSTILFFACLGLGSVVIPWSEILKILTGGGSSKASWEQIVLAVRLPRVITAMLAGSALAVGGLEMQTLFRNPLADPFLLGITSGASLGVALVVLATGVAGAGLFAHTGILGGLGIVGAATLGSAAVLSIVLLLGRRVRHMATLLIVGLMVGYATGALVSVLLSFSLPEEIQAFVHWTFGSFGRVSESQLMLLAPAVLGGLIAAHLLAKPLDALLLGEETARSLGQNVLVTRLVVVGSASLLAGSVTAFCGPIAFIGVAIPHLCRGLFRTSGHRWLLPACTLLGASVAMLADLVARLPGSDRALPLNAVTAMLGAPVVLYIVLRMGRHEIVREI